VTSTVARDTDTLQNLLEEQYQTYTKRLLQLTVCSRLHDCGGYAPHTLDALIAWARRGVADAASALRRMSEGTYGSCECCGLGIPAARLQAHPEARCCAACRREDRR
jgi:DnaK suppressor protein